MKTHILAFGAHPDDIEVACAGTLIAAVQEGKTVAVVDLTQGELGTRGCPKTRLTEAAEAAEIMGVHARENLSLKDAFFDISKENLCRVITVIRKYQPDIIVCNALQDRHPDHARGAQLVSEAAFLSGLPAYTTMYEGKEQAHWQPARIFHYLQHMLVKPDFVVDISAQLELKLKSILAYRTQFNGSPTDDMPETFISDPLFMNTVKGRAGMLGRETGVKYAEGFICAQTLCVKGLDAFV